MSLFRVKQSLRNFAAMKGAITEIVAALLPLANSLFELQFRAGVFGWLWSYERYERGQILAESIATVNVNCNISVRFAHLFFSLASVEASVENWALSQNLNMEWNRLPQLRMPWNFKMNCSWIRCRLFVDKTNIRNPAWKNLCLAAYEIV